MMHDELLQVSDTLLGRTWCISKMAANFFLCQLFFNFSHLFDAFRALFWFQLL